MVDYYLEDTKRLNDQPKRTIADYVEQNGILVPRRFDSLAAARASGLPFIARSEHSQEYAGVSGLLNSLTSKPEYDMLQGIASEEALRDKVLEPPKAGINVHKQYCLYLDIDEEEFKRGVSFSFWELLGGYNRMIVADSAIQGRYHITTYSNDLWFVNFSLVEAGEVKVEYQRRLTDELHEGIPALIALYEHVRNLPHFDKDHCPVMEIQTVGTKNYFLQYHRARDFIPACFILDRAPDSEEVEANFVRGATSSEGFTCNMTLFDAFWYGDIKMSWTLPLDQVGHGSFDETWNHVLPELMVKRRRLQIIQTKSLDWAMGELALGHLNRSKLYKPEVSIIQEREKLYTEEEAEQLLQRVRETGEDQKIRLHVISDGRRAYLKRV